MSTTQHLPLAPQIWLQLTIFTDYIYLLRYIQYGRVSVNHVVDCIAVVAAVERAVEL